MRFGPDPAEREGSGRADVLEFSPIGENRHQRTDRRGRRGADLGQPMRGVPALAQVAACQIGRPLRGRAAAVGLRFGARDQSGAKQGRGERRTARAC